MVISMIFRCNYKHRQVYIIYPTLMINAFNKLFEKLKEKDKTSDNQKKKLEN